jgi:LuxR family maltose regulon positive regulatory protein
LRAHNQLNELRANELRFSTVETALFLKQVMRLDLSEEQVDALEARTEGWIAGLQIAALSMQSHEDPQTFLQAFSGSHRHILAYLAEEVLNRQSNSIQEFLMQTSILERLCGPLCDAVTGASDGQSILENLERANLFITQLDEEGLWYRYHRLFLEVLQTRLQQVRADQIHEFHRRAQKWYSHQGMITEAMPHAIASEEFDEAAGLIESVAGKMLRQGSIISLSRWLDAIPAERIRAHPRLCLARGWTIFMGPAVNLENAESWAQLALRVAQADGSIDSALTGEVSALQAMIAITRGEGARSRHLAQQALDELPLNSPWRNAVTFSLGTANLEFGDVGAAARAFEEALRLSQAESEFFVQLAAASFLADIEVFQGHLNRASEMYQMVLERSDPDLPQKGTIMAYGGLANILCERDQLVEALDYIQLGASQVERVGGEYAAFVLNRVLARLQQAQGHWRESFDILNEAYERGTNAQVKLVMRQTLALRANLQLMQGDRESAVIWAENSGLSPEDEEVNHPGWREVEYLTLARVVEAQGRHEEALSLLDRLRDSAETEERCGNEIAILALQSVIFHRNGNTALAFKCLARALTLAEPEGYIRIFADEGEPMRLLLTDYKSAVEKQIGNSLDGNLSRLLPYIDRLMAAFPQPPFAETSKDGSLLEPLSERELDILRLIASGRSNQEIADILVIAISTVKSHINNLYGKLGTNRRTQAIAIARQQGLLAD